MRRNTVIFCVLVCHLVSSIWRSTRAPKEVTSTLPHFDFRSRTKATLFFFALIRKKMHCRSHSRVKRSGRERRELRVRECPPNSIANLFTNAFSPRYSFTVFVPSQRKITTDSISLRERSSRDPRMLRKLKLENLVRAVAKFFKREHGGRRRLVIGHDKAERYITRVGIMA